VEDTINHRLSNTIRVTIIITEIIIITIMLTMWLFWLSEKRIDERYTDDHSHTRRIINGWNGCNM